MSVTVSEFICFIKEVSRRDLLSFCRFLWEWGGYQFMENGYWRVRGRKSTHKVINARREILFFRHVREVGLARVPLLNLASGPLAAPRIFFWRRPWSRLCGESKNRAWNFLIKKTLVHCLWDSWKRVKIWAATWKDDLKGVLYSGPPSTEPRRKNYLQQIFLNF